MAKNVQLLFSPAMARANVLGWKSETRRMRDLKDINKNPDNWEFIGYHDSTGYGGFFYEFKDLTSETTCIYGYKSPYGMPGDILCQRESVRRSVSCTTTGWAYSCDNECVYIGSERMALFEAWQEKNKNRANIPAMHMPDFLCRFRRVIKSVTIERLNDITDEGAWNEGIIIPDPNDESKRLDPKRYTGMYREYYKKLFAEINGQEVADKNPFIWVVKY